MKGSKDTTYSNARGPVVHPFKSSAVNNTRGPCVEGSKIVANSNARGLGVTGSKSATDNNARGPGVKGAPKNASASNARGPDVRGSKSADVSNARSNPNGEPYPVLVVLPAMLGAIPTVSHIQPWWCSVLAVALAQRCLLPIPMVSYIQP